MNILVTGAGGFLGFYIARDLKELGHRVYNFSRSHHRDLDQLEITTRIGNLNNPKSIENALEDIDAVFHVAGKVAMWGKWDDFYQTNTIGTKNLVEACKKKGIKKLIYTSTPSVVFGEGDLLGQDETLNYPKKYLSLYAKSKMLAEKYVLDQNSESFLTCSLRPHLIFGPRDKNIIPRLIEASKKNKLKIVGDGENLVDIIYVENAAKAHIQAFEKLTVNSKVAGSSYFIAQERPVKLWDFINQILQINGQSPITKKIPTNTAYRIGAIIEFFLKLFRVWNIHPPMTRFVALQLGKSHYFSHKKAQADFNYSPSISIEEAIEKIRP
ncbi:NAD-dependent epimerase/dehydratase family protein [Halobacteriovorax sp. JY17]|uniref:NAD-dependent epimerase/dehydratase family protein n=1 Tax=Halobacteriovorax sp. JY17 TaxID=2014617 RepID=UPI000C37AC60|nr:NAD-dependent epimerase/dehydratase family protein [Halobacteriovorax sp. JY17]PIK15452.1 MAG: 3-beta hydroxysteroid dehydrogenase [Halobacteriovorax sp. JY17]